MTTMRFTKAHEREERRLLRKGFMHSCAGLALCWLPVVGLLFSISGFWRVLVRLTRRYRKKRAACLVFSFLCLTLCTGMLLGEIWVYSRDPDILSRTGQQIWTFMVGEENAGALSGPVRQGTQYEDMDRAGLGVTDTMGTENDILWQDEDISAWDDGFDWAAWESDTFAADGEIDWGGEDGWADEDWADDSAWLETDEAGAIGESSAAQSEGNLSMGKGERILPPTQ